MKKIIIILIVLIIATVIYAADVKWSALAELLAIADDDVLCVIDTDAGTSKKITVLNFFDTIDTFAELNTIVADKTLVNEEDAATWDSIITFATNIAFSDAATIDQSANNYIDFTENSDILQFYFDATDLGIIWSDGALNLQNAEDAIDAIVNILGKDAGEKGILRILSDGDDNFIELHHDDTDGHIITDTGDIHIEAAGGDISFADDNIATSGTAATGVLTVTGVINTSVGIDAVGAVDMDYGTADVTDHTFLTDGTGTAEIVLPAGSIDGTELLDDTVDSADYAALSIDAEHLAADIVDETKISDDGIDSEHYNDASIDLVHLAAGVYAKDIVTTAPVTGATDNVLVGADGDVTLALDFTAAWDFGGAASLELPNAAAPTTDATGEIALDTTIADHQPLHQYYDGGENMTIIAIDTAQLPALDNEIVKYDAASDKFVLEADSSGGTTAWDDIANPDNAGLTTITFDNAELSLFTGDNDAAASFITIQNTDADHTGGNLWLLDLDYSADDGDADADFIKCQDSGGTVFSVSANGVIAGGNTTITGSLEASTITEGLVAVPNVDETSWVAAAEMADSDHGDVEWATNAAKVQACTIADTVYASCYVGLFQGATGDNEPFYTDGALTYDATSGTLSSTVLTEGGNAVYNSTETPGGSLGNTWADPTIDDLFIKLGGDVASAGDYDFGSANADLELPQTSPAVPDVDGQIELDFTDGKVVIQHGSAHAELAASTDVVVGTLIKSWSATIFEPDGVNDVMTVKAINSIEFPHGVVITAIYLGVSEDSNYTLTVQNFDDFDTINGANGTIDAVAYTADTTGEIIDTSPTYATIAAGQIIMISIPATDVDWIHFEIYYYEPAA